MDGDRLYVSMKQSSHSQLTSRESVVDCCHDRDQQIRQLQPPRIS